MAWRPGWGGRCNSDKVCDPIGTARAGGHCAGHTELRVLQAVDDDVMRRRFGHASCVLTARRLTDSVGPQTLGNSLLAEVWLGYSAYRLVIVALAA